jgi:hypothetical protein
VAGRNGTTRGQQREPFGWHQQGPQQPRLHRRALRGWKAEKLMVVARRRRSPSSVDGPGRSFSGSSFSPGEHLM